MDDVDFSSIYQRHAADVYRFAIYMSGNIQTAEDVTAETFARAWTVRGRIRVGTGAAVGVCPADRCVASRNDTHVVTITLSWDRI